MGHCHVYSRSRDSAREGSLDHQHLDKIHRHRYSWQYRYLVHLLAHIRFRRAQAELQHRIRQHFAHHHDQPEVLAYNRRPARCMPDPRFRMEIRQAHVLSTDIPPRAGDPEVQHPGLPTEVRTVPSSLLHPTTFIAYLVHR